MHSATGIQPGRSDFPQNLKAQPTSAERPVPDPMDRIQCLASYSPTLGGGMPVELRRAKQLVSRDLLISYYKSKTFTRLGTRPSAEKAVKLIFIAPLPLPVCVCILALAVPDVDVALTASVLLPEPVAVGVDGDPPPPVMVAATWTSITLPVMVWTIVCISPAASRRTVQTAAPVCAPTAVLKTQFCSA